MDLAAYRALFAATPAPTPAQVDAFVAYVAGKHSWYKHLPLFPPGVDFVVYLDPGAGMQRFAQADGEQGYREIAGGDTRFHHAMLATQAYRERFGLLNVIEQRAPGFELHGSDGVLAMGTGPGVLVDGELLEIPPEVALAGRAAVTAVLDERACQGFLWGDYFDGRFDQPPSGQESWPAESGGAEVVAALRRMHADAAYPLKHRRSEIAELIAPERERQRAGLRAAAMRVLALVYGEAARASAAEATTLFARADAAPPAPSLRVTRPDQLTPLILDLADPAQRQLGDYELLQMIGQGGMGIVYRARQRSLDRIVAVKLLAGSQFSPEFVARFQSEAQRAARMQHPNIVTIHEIGATERFGYFSMQLVEGQTLAERLRRDGPMREAEAAAALRVLAEAVEYAHELNVLHLDLKPANVLVDGNGRYYIADFGLARPLDQALASELDEISGTPSYMAPEQIEVRRHRLSRATDIYGLGAMLYEFLTGHPPFRGDDAQDTLRRVLEEAPAPLRAQVPGLSRDMEAICLQCLAKAPADRYDSARELALDLGRLLDGHPISIRQPSALERLQRWRRQHALSMAAMAGVFLAMAAGLVGFAWLYFQQLRYERQEQVSGLAANAIVSTLETPQARARDYLNKALRAFDDDDGTGEASAVAGVDMARQSLIATGDPALARDANLADAYAHARLLWADALERRGTPAALLASTFFARSGEEADAEGQRVFHALDRAAAAAPTDPVLLSIAAAWCRPFAQAPDCPHARVRALLRKVEPDNAFDWAVAAPWGYEARYRQPRLAQEAAAWSGRPLVYRSHEREAFARMLAEVDAVAPEVLQQTGVRNVDAGELATFTAVTELQLGILTDSLPTLDGLQEYCLATTPDAQRAALCSAFDKALAEGADSDYERAYLARWRAARAGAPIDPEPARTDAWQRHGAALLRASVARYDPARSYLRDLVSSGLGPARVALLRANGVPLEPPPGWQPRK